jgi:hypothetical protein
MSCTVPIMTRAGVDDRCGWKEDGNRGVSGWVRIEARALDGGFVRAGRDRVPAPGSGWGWTSPNPHERPLDMYPEKQIAEILFLSLSL